MYLSQWFKLAVRRCAEDGVVSKEEAEELHFHSLRHGFARYHLSDKQVPVNVVSAWLGHTKTSLTWDIYGGVSGGQYKGYMD